VKTERYSGIAKAQRVHSYQQVEKKVVAIELVGAVVIVVEAGAKYHYHYKRKRM